MAKESILDELKKLENEIPPRNFEIVMEFYRDYRKAISNFSKAESIFSLFLQLIREQFKKPYVFDLYHKKIRHPIDYYHFGIEFIRPLVDLPHSGVIGLDVVDTISKQLEKKENVVLFANHQTETDPMAISLLLEKTHPKLAESIIYVAGERVITDPLAIPFSMGCDLLCIYSKRYIDHPPEEKEEKQLHNKKTMELMSRLLKEGGKIIYVAPSGGRDRRNAQGVIEIAPFDPDSIEMFYLMARKSKTPTHFYPFTLATYDLLPPPESIQKELGEARSAKRAPIHLHFSREFSMEKFPGSDETDKQKRRAKRAQALWSIVDIAYRSLQ